MCIYVVTICLIGKTYSYNNINISCSNLVFNSCVLTGNYIKVANITEYTNTIYCSTNHSKLYTTYKILKSSYEPNHCFNPFFLHQLKVCLF